jgi:hypothetical protein
MFLNFQHLLKDLRNILLCSYFIFLGKLKYPSKILPKRSFKNYLDFDVLFDTQSTYLIRRSDRSKEVTFDQLGDTQYILREDVLNIHDIPNLSVNLLGGKFKVQHTKFRVFNKSLGSKRWNGSSKIYLSEHIDSYTIEKEYSPIFIDSTNIHDLSIPYQKPFDKHTERLLRELNIEIKPENNKYNFTGKIRFVPDPINLNYWHFELKVLDYKNEIIDNNSSNWLKEFCGQILRDVIIVNSSPLEPEVVKIPSQFYLKEKGIKVS